MLLQRRLSDPASPRQPHVPAPHPQSPSAAKVFSLMFPWHLGLDLAEYISQRNKRKTWLQSTTGCSGRPAGQLGTLPPEGKVVRWLGICERLTHKGASEQQCLTLTGICPLSPAQHLTRATKCLHAKQPYSQLTMDRLLNSLSAGQCCHQQQGLPRAGSSSRAWHLGKQA